jgi:hypothetical protein
MEACWPSQDIRHDTRGVWTATPDNYGPLNLTRGRRHSYVKTWTSMAPLTLTEDDF